MKIETIIEDLVNHEISKYEAISKLKEITDGLRGKSSIEMTVESIAFTVGVNDGILKLRKNYGYEDIKGIKEGDRVDITLIP
jgi:hypothetical protein